MTLEQIKFLEALLAPNVPGYSKCYVRGCYQNAGIGRLHKHAGPVDACQDHDPERVGYAVAFGIATPQPTAQELEAQAQAAQAEAVEEMSVEEALGQMFRDLVLAATKKQRPAKGPDDGQLTRLKKPIKPLPPSGDALVQPNTPFRPLVIS
jgi:hypothetical protein